MGESTEFQQNGTETHQKGWVEISQYNQYGERPWDRGDFLLALKEKSEPIDLKTESGKELLFSCPKEKKTRIETILNLLSLSPQFQIIDPVESAGILFSGGRTQLANDVLNKRFSTDNERMLFDPTFNFKESPRQLLFSPFSIPEQLRKKLFATARQNQKEHRNDIKLLLGSVSLGGQSRERSAKPKEESSRKGNILSRSLGHILGMPISVEEKRQLFAEAYDNLIKQVDSREFFDTYFLPGDKDFRILANDYMNPLLILMEELENRSYDIKLFRAATPNEQVQKSKDSLQDSIVVLADKRSMDAIGEFYYGAMQILRELYKGKGILDEGSEYLDHLEGHKPNVEWEQCGFSEEERDRIVALTLQMGLAAEESNFELQQNEQGRKPKPITTEYLEELRSELRRSKVKPADQIFLRQIVSRIVDKQLSSKA